jgi:hypothetical protein
MPLPIRGFTLIKIPGLKTNVQHNYNVKFILNHLIYRNYRIYLPQIQNYATTCYIARTPGLV